MHSAVITKPKGNIFAVLDIGTTKMVCLIVKISSNGNQKIVGVGHKVAEGINGGAITNVKHANRAILSTIDMAKQASGETIDQVYVNISGCNISSFELTNETTSTRHEISDGDITRIISQTYEKYDEDDVVIHNIPIRYSLDDMNNINELRGLYGGKLHADMHVVTASRPALLNIENCIVSCHLSMAGCTASSYTSGLSCLSEDEKDLGTVIVDIGGGYTSIGLFEKGKFIHADFIPIGGMHITRDIAYGLCISIAEAERIKILHGSCISIPGDESKYIDVLDVENANNGAIQIAKSEVTSIIKPRIEEILEILNDKLGRKNNLIRKVVITGGSSQLTNIKEVANYILNRQIRIGIPFSIDSIDSQHHNNPVFSAAMGMVSLVSSTYKNILDSESKANRLLSWIRAKMRA